MAEFTPKQLDALEDALEDLEVDADLGDLALDPELAARLAEYRQVLALTRDAFPLDEVPEGLLDGVLAEAREVARSTPAPTPEPRESWARAWQRWRSTLIPLASLAAAASLVLWIASPGTTPSSEPPELAQAERVDADEQSPPSPDERTREADSVEPGAASEMPIEPPSQPGTAPSDAALGGAKPPATSPLETKTTTAKQAGAGGSASKAKPMDTTPTPALEPVEEATALDKDDAWSELERADAARHKGECDRARKIYDGILAATSSSSVVGRAKAGIGLCLEQDGKKSQAETWFDQARSTSPGVDAWIRNQRDEQPLPGEKKQKAKEPAAFPAGDAL